MVFSLEALLLAVDVAVVADVADVAGVAVAVVAVVAVVVVVGAVVAVLALGWTFVSCLHQVSIFLIVSDNKKQTA